jgi:hypothetical protein
MRMRDGQRAHSHFMASAVDVSKAVPADGDVLVWSASASAWAPGVAGGGGGVTKIVTSSNVAIDPTATNTIVIMSGSGNDVAFPTTAPADGNRITVVSYQPGGSDFTASIGTGYSMQMDQGFGDVVTAGPATSNAHTNGGSTLGAANQRSWIYDTASTTWFRM